jgi:hypothetical protein
MYLQDHIQVGQTILQATMFVHFVDICAVSFVSSFHTSVAYGLLHFRAESTQGLL